MEAAPTKSDTLRARVPQVWCGGVLVAVLAVLSLACSVDDSPAEDDVGETEESATTGPQACPTHIRTERVASLVKLSYGFTGFGHGASPTAGPTVSYELYDCDDECRRCRFRGPVDNIGETAVNNRRCRNDLTLACESDADCGGVEGECEYFWNPPAQTNSIGWTGTFFSRLSEEEMARFGVATPHGAHGVFNLSTGEITFDVANARVDGGIGTVPPCIGDTTPLDGQKDGLCDGTQTACDVTASSALASVSFDCVFPPRSFTFNLPQHGASTSGLFWELDDTRPMCTKDGAQDERCWCGVCSDDSTLPCFADNQCLAGTCGNVGTAEEPIETAQNVCGPGEVCNWDEEQLQGTCARASGDMVGCMPTDGLLSVSGAATVQDDFYVSTIGLLACLPRIEVPNVLFLDAQFGFPGVIIQRVPYKITPEFR